MSNHSGTIHTVRFSPNGKYVASGADDKIVCVYMLESNPPSHSATFGMTVLLSGVRVRVRDLWMFILMVYAMVYRHE